MKKIDENIRITLRIPKSVHKSVKYSANLSGKSLNSEIIDRLCGKITTPLPEKKDVKNPEYNIFNQERGVVNPKLILNSTDIRLAKAVLRLKDAELAKEIGIGLTTLKRIEADNDGKSVKIDTLNKARGKLDDLLLTNGWRLCDGGILPLLTSR